jgi:hypothetical protein
MARRTGGAPVKYPSSKAASASLSRRDAMGLFFWSMPKRWRSDVLVMCSRCTYRRQPLTAMVDLALSLRRCPLPLSFRTPVHAGNVLANDPRGQDPRGDPSANADVCGFHLNGRQRASTAASTAAGGYGGNSIWGQLVAPNVAPGCQRISPDPDGRKNARLSYEETGSLDFGGSSRTLLWYHRQESNLYLALRRRSFYPLNYGGGV